MRHQDRAVGVDVDQGACLVQELGRKADACMHPPHAEAHVDRVSMITCLARRSGCLGCHYAQGPACFLECAFSIQTSSLQNCSRAEEKLA